MVYDADGVTGVHVIRANNTDVMRIYSTGITAYKPLVATAGFFSNATASSFYVGGDNIFDLYAITEPKIRNGIASGPGDGATRLVFNNAINSWYSTGFVDTCYKRCNAIIDHRTGNFLTNGIISAGGTVYTPTIMGTNGLEYDTSTSTGIHNFKINGVQKCI